MQVRRANVVLSRYTQRGRRSSLMGLPRAFLGYGMRRRGQGQARPLSRGKSLGLQTRLARSFLPPSVSRLSRFLIATTQCRLQWRGTSLAAVSWAVFFVFLSFCLPSFLAASSRRLRTFQHLLFGTSADVGISRLPSVVCRRHSELPKLLLHPSLTVCRIGVEITQTASCPGKLHVVRISLFYFIFVWSLLIFPSDRTHTTK